MGRRKIEEHNIRSLTKISGGNSYAITLPIDFVRKLKWKARQKLEVTIINDRLIVRDWNPEEQK